jgi:hypothetical protein
MTSVSGVGRDRDLRESGLLAWLRLMRVFQKVDRVSGERLRVWDLSVGQFDVLGEDEAGNLAASADLTSKTAR